MNRRFRLLLFLIALVFVLAFLLMPWRRGAAPQSGLLSQQAYVWQRSWTPAVRDAVDASRNDVSGYAVLAAEVSFASGRLQVAHVTPDWRVLAQSTRPVGLALRIGPYHGRFASKDITAARLAGLSRSLLAEAREAGVEPSELEIDFDCAESKLDGYQVWLETIRAAVAPTSVAFTALPSWLKNSQFARLARSADGYILQVHSLDRPRSIDAPMTLCGASAAARAVEVAGRIGVPFRVALPTYGYLVAFDDHGQFVGLSAEGPNRDWPASTQVRTLSADPQVVAALVSRWRSARPACMTGLIWYRLPTGDDALNWRMPTLRAVMAGTRRSLPMSRRFNRNGLALCLGSAVFATPAGACGPFFPNLLLFNGSASVTWAPVASFDHEVKRILPATALHAIPPAENHDVYDQSIEIDLTDLRSELNELGTPAARRQELLEAYDAVRQRLAAQIKERDRAKEDGTTQPATPAGLMVPDGLPPEFSAYLCGLIAYSARHTDEARAAWESLLQLPPDQRRYRSLWAQFMIGKSYLEEDSAKAIDAFRRVRELARSGEKDPLGLAAASLGWEARAELNQKHDAAAIDLYLQQCASGDPTAVQSMAIACGRAFGESDAAQMKELAGNPSAARVMTAYAVSNGVWSRRSPTNQMVQRWLAAVESAGAGKVIGAERLAWAAYQSGDMAGAKRWLALAPTDAPIAMWVKAKLLLRAGKVDAAAEVLARTVPAFPPNEAWQGAPGTYEQEDVLGGPGLLPARRAAAELGVLELSRGNYVEALDRLLRAGWWIDAAYVAERVLTVDELVAYVDRNWPDAKQSPIRHLLARRLTRLGRWKEARPYFPAELRPKLDEYIAAIRAGHDEKLEAKGRGRMLWTAARIARRSGMELLGTELAPDDALDGGIYTGVDMADARKKDKEKLLPPTHDELNRAAASAPQPDRRFHYRYIAIDHAWAAAELLPDGTDELAALLCEAGGWIKDRDPRAANRFYKALVTRCGNTDLGRAAAAKKWFPDRKAATANAGT